MSIQIAGSSGITFPNSTVQTTNGALTLMTAKTATGTFIDFTGIPSWAKRITVMFAGVSTSGTSPIILQLGNGSVQTTGYSSGASSGTTGTYPTSGLAITSGGSATNIISGCYVVNYLKSNIYCGFGNNTMNLSANVPMVCAGSVSLSNTINIVRITTVNETDTFDAGTINVMYEG